MKHIKGIANILADSGSRLKGVGLYHDLDFQNSQPGFCTPFQPLLPVEQVTHASITVHKHFTKPNVGTLGKQFMVSQIENPDIPLECVFSKDAPNLDKN